MGGGVAVQQAATYQYGVGNAQLGEGMSYSGGYAAGQGGVAYGSIAQPAQVEMVVSENVSVPVTETVTIGVPTVAVPEVGAVTGIVLTSEAPSILCSETVGVTRTEQSLKLRALAAPAPGQATKVTGVGRHVPVACQQVFNAVASVTPLTNAVKKFEATRTLEASQTLGATQSLEAAQTLAVLVQCQPVLHAAAACVTPSTTAVKKVQAA